MRFQAFCADRLLLALQPEAGSRLLDVAAGNGTFAISAEQAIRPGGRVIAVDASENSLAGLYSKISQFGIDAIDVHCLDATKSGFRRDYFQYVVCSLELHRFTDPGKAFREWYRILRPAGHLGVCSLEPGAFQPFLGLLQRRLMAMHLDFPIPWQFTGDRSWLQEQLFAAGFQTVDLQEIQLGYHLATAEQWWEIIENSPLQSWLAPLSATQRQSLKTEHQAEVMDHIGRDGLWLDVPVLLGVATKR